jgi:glycosyltransferase involved in cell wall biosynthesis
MMLSGQDFIVFSDDWGRHPFSCQHLMRQFLPHNRVIWVHTVGMRRPRLTLYDLKRSIQKLRSFTTSSDPVDLPRNLTTLSPVMLPFGNPLVRRFNRDSVVRTVRRKMAELEFHDPILLTTLPNATDYLGAFEEKAAVYYCVDDFTLWPGVNRRLVAEMEEKLLAGVDLLVCSSPELARLKQRDGLRTEVIPHGVDFEHFARAGSPPCETVPALAGLKKPAIGYFGLLGEWVDLPLLEEITRRHPEWTLVLIGTVVADTTRLAAYPNVLFTGPISYDRLPDHVAYLDALILPYLTEGRGQSITPLKLREYIATGKPVVTTDIPECRLYQDVINIATSHNEFVAALERAILEGDARSRGMREAVKGDDWTNRAEMLSAFMVPILSVGKEDSDGRR